MAIQKSSAPTIIDVAERAGVSRATASRAMEATAESPQKLLSLFSAQQPNSATAQMKLHVQCVRVAPRQSGS